MKYPKLHETSDLRKKLMAQDIADIRRAYEQALPFHTKSEIMKRRQSGLEVHSKAQWISQIMEMYQVSYHTIYYWTHDDYRAEKMIKNAKAHSKENGIEDYERHRAKESKRRVERWARNASLREWHYVTSARNEKRSNRKTVSGKPIVLGKEDS